MGDRWTVSSLFAPPVTHIESPTACPSVSQLPELRVKVLPAATKVTVSLFVYPCTGCDQVVSNPYPSVEKFLRAFISRVIKATESLPPTDVVVATSESWKFPVSVVPAEFPMHPPTWAPTTPEITLADQHRVTVPLAAMFPIRPPA